MIVQYVRDEDYNLIGTVVAIDKNKIGVSQCNPRDNFNKKLGTEIAKGRAATRRHDWIQYVTLDKSDYFYPVVQKVLDRSRKYFKYTIAELERRTIQEGQ
jgi:hypothetical protein